MLSDLFIAVWAKQRQKMEGNVMFYQLCLDHLGFLATEHHFEIQCDSWYGKESYIAIHFVKDTEKISVTTELPFDLPILRTAEISAEELTRRFGIENAPGDFYKTESRVHPLDALGKEGVRRAYTDALIQRIMNFGEFVRANYDKLVRA